MSRTWKRLILPILTVLFLAACSESVEDSTSKGIKAAEKVFYDNDKQTTAEIEGIHLYKPMGFVVSEQTDVQNIIFTKGKETYILFVNPNEQKGSRLFYDLLSVDQHKEMIATETFTDDGTFGFVAVMKSDNDHVELIASVDGAKITTLSSNDKIAPQLTKMMAMVRSIK